MIITNKWNNNFKNEKKESKIKLKIKEKIKNSRKRKSQFFEKLNNIYSKNKINL